MFTRISILTYLSGGKCKKLGKILLLKLFEKLKEPEFNLVYNNRIIVDI